MQFAPYFQTGLIGTSSNFMAYSPKAASTSTSVTTPLRVVVYNSVTGTIIKEGGDVSITSNGELLIGTETVVGKVTIKGGGDATGKAFAVVNSSGTTTAFIQDNGKMELGQGTNALPSLTSIGGAYGLNFPNTAEITMGRMNGQPMFRFGEVGISMKGYLGFSSEPSSTAPDIYINRVSSGKLQILEVDGATPGSLVIGKLFLDKTITAAATTGAQTINKSTGSVNFAATESSLVVTNSLVTVNSVIICTVGTNDSTMTSVQAVAAAGSFTIHSNAAANAETRVNFLLTN